MEIVISEWFRKLLTCTFKRCRNKNFVVRNISRKREEMEEGVGMGGS